MIRTLPNTPVRTGSRDHDHPVEDLINKLVRDGSAPASNVVIARPVTIAEDEPGSDPYNHTGRFHKIFK